MNYRSRARYTRASAPKACRSRPAPRAVRRGTPQAMRCPPARSIVRRRRCRYCRHI